VPDPNQSLSLQAAISEGDCVEINAKVGSHLPNRGQQRPSLKLATRNQSFYFIDELLVERPCVSFINRNEHIV
jgi:hypothetical protein